MLDINVNKNPVESPQHFAAGLLKVLWKGNVISGRKNILVLNDVVDPLYQSDDVLGSGELDRLLVLDLVLPEVLVLRTSSHHRAVLVITGSRLQIGVGVCDLSEEDLESAEEVHNVSGDEIILVLSRGNLDNVLEVNGGLEGSAGIFVEAVARLSVVSLRKTFRKIPDTEK